jgi:flavin reductase (DIM6/NTAB) family NADH-FMN oxidoreductase RutF
MAIDHNELRRIMGHFATGVTVVTTHDGNGRSYGLTANAVCSLSLSPPLILVCVDKSAESHPAFERSRVFAVNILSDAQQELSRRFAVSGGEKFAGLPHHPGTTGSPILEGAARRVPRLALTRVGSHHHVGAVESGATADGQPLLFFRALPSSRRRLTSLLAVGTRTNVKFPGTCTLPALLIVILAAGRGTRMRSGRARSCTRLLAVPDPRRSDAALQLARNVRPSSSDTKPTKSARLRRPSGALRRRARCLPAATCAARHRRCRSAAVPVLEGLGDVLISRDVPGLRTSTMAELVAHHRATGRRLALTAAAD